MIRQATMNDIEAMITLGKAVLVGSANSEMTVDDNKCRRNMAMMIASKQFFSVVSECDGKVNGFMFGMVESMFFTNVKYATDIAIVANSGGSLMIKRFLVWAKLQGAKSVMFGISTGIDTDRTGKLYEALGLKHVGGIYSKEI
jgi:hypothetical protein